MAFHLWYSMERDRTPAMTSAEKKRLYQNLGAQIRDYRQDTSLSQEKLGEKVGLSRSSIVNIEKGRQRPPLHTLWGIAEALDASLEDLIPTEEEVRSPEEVDPDLRGRIAEQMDGEDAEAVRRIADFIEESGTDS